MKRDKFLYTSILEAQLIKNKNLYIGLTKEECERKNESAKMRITKWEEKGKTKEWIACRIYSMYLDNNRISKAVTAQRFASKLKGNKEGIVDVLKTADEFKYLRGAIYHVTRKQD